MNRKRIVCILVCLCLAASLPACKKPVRPAADPSEGLAMTDIDLLKDGKSDFTIVVREDANTSDAYAASELSDFFFEATGWRLPVVHDDTAFGEADKLISIGKTKLFSASGLTVSEEALNKDGFILKRAGNRVYLAGATDDGTLYAAYSFLEKALGFRFYAADETYYETQTDLKLPDFDITDVPDFAHRNVYFKAIKDNWFVRGRFRSQNNDAWGLFAHSYFQLLPPDVYRGGHEEWYYPRKGEPVQLCLTAPGLVDELTANLKKVILDKKDARYFMVGQEDTSSFCECDRCKLSKAKYGGESGVMMVFINDVARRIAEWQAVACPDREIYVATFAYQRTKSAPAVHDETTDSYRPAHEEVVAEDNVMVQFAPLEACYAHDMYAECNSTFESAINGWKAVCKNFAVWSYSTNFTNYLLNFNNFGTLQADYRIYRDMGAIVFMDQGTGETIASPFHDMRIYIQSQLMWDADSDVLQLTDDFMRAYYKDVYEPIRAYYDLIRIHYASLDSDMVDAEKGEFHSHVYNSYGLNNEQSMYWPKTLLDQCADLFDEAYGILDGMTDEKTVETLRRRVLGEQLAIKYLYIQFYYGYYTKEEQFALVDAFEEDAKVCGLVCWKENTPLGEKLTEWRNAIKLR